MNTVRCIALAATLHLVTGCAHGHLHLNPREAAPVLVHPPIHPPVHITVRAGHIGH